MTKYTSIEIAVISIVVVAAIGSGIRYFNTDNGIYADPNGESVYIQDSSCTVNMEEEDLDTYELYRRFDFCVQKHMEVHGR